MQTNTIDQLLTNYKFRTNTILNGYYIHPEQIVTGRNKPVEYRDITLSTECDAVFTCSAFKNNGTSLNSYSALEVSLDYDKSKSAGVSFRIASSAWPGSTYEIVKENRQNGYYKSEIDNTLSHVALHINCKPDTFFNSLDIAQLVINNITLSAGNQDRSYRFSDFEDHFNMMDSQFQSHYDIQNYDLSLSSVYPTDAVSFYQDEQDTKTRIFQTPIFESKQQLILSQNPLYRGSKVITNHQLSGNNNHKVNYYLNELSKGNAYKTFQTFPYRVEYLGVAGEVLDSDETDLNSANFMMHKDGGFTIKSHGKGYLDGYNTKDPLRNPKEAIIVPLKFRLYGDRSSAKDVILPVSISFSSGFAL